MALEEIMPGRLLRLRAEMLIQGRAWLKLRATPRESVGGTNSAPVPAQGTRRPPLLEGNLARPLVVFDGMADNIAQAAERTASAVAGPGT